jgi:hypothetical protein
MPTTLNTLRQRGEQIRNEQRDRLQMQLGVHPSQVWNSRHTGRTPNVMDPLGISTFKQPGALNTQYGVTPTPYDVDRYMGVGGGQRVVPTPEGAGGYPGGAGYPAEQGGGPQQPAPMDDLLLQYSTALQAERDKANAANLARYNEALGLQTDLGQRNQERVANWGTAASADIDDRLQEQLGDNMAFLASRGLSNSTIAPAFAARAAKDTAREQQRVSEMRDSRLSEYDTRDTGNRIGIIERREDVAPSLESMARLALEYGRSGDGEGMQALQGEVNSLREQLAQRYQPQVAYQGGGGFSPYAAQQFQNAMNGAFGGGFAFPSMGGGSYPQSQPSEARPTSAKRGDGKRMSDRELQKALARADRFRQRDGDTGKIISQPKYKVPLGFQAPQYA